MPFEKILGTPMGILTASANFNWQSSSVRAKRGFHI
jgi:hypothetical protein